jgi:hypothetical protein
MATHDGITTTPRLRLSDRTLGALIGAATLLAILVMAHHPVASAGNLPDLVAGIARKAVLNGVVHGTLIALLGVLLFAFAEFSARPALDRPLARAALLAYAIGAGASMLAALINGVIVGALAQRYGDADAASLEHVRHLLRFCWQANQAFADTGEVARGIGIVLWSCALLRSRRGVGVGIAGLVLGGVPALLVATGLLQLDLHGAMLALLAAAAWNLAIAVQLVRGKI